MKNCACHVDECLLCEARMYHGLSHDQACDLRGLLSHRRYEAHTTIFRQGDPSEFLFVVQEGMLKMTLNDADGREQIIGLPAPGQLLGFNSVGEHTYAYTVVALTPSAVCKIQHRDMLEILHQNPGVAMRTIEMLNQELGQARSLIHILGQKTAVEKIATFILSLHAHAPTEGDAQTAALPLSRQEMAELLGLTVETVSRLMSEFKRDGLLEAPRGHVRILDRERLRKIAGSVELSVSANISPGHRVN